MIKKIFGIVVFVAVFVVVPFYIFSLEKDPEIKNGISIGNALDAPLGEYWGVTMSKDLLTEIKVKGFDTVRLPVRFSDYIDKNYLLNEEFMLKLDDYIKHALELDLIVVLDMHHFVELMDSDLIGYNNNKVLPNDFNYEKAFYEMWEQLSYRYKDYSDKLFFEILNEPENDITPSKWNEMVSKTIDIIRENNSDRKIIISTAKTAIVEAIEYLELPNDDDLIVTFHYYTPMEFTFQNDENHEDYMNSDEVVWESTIEDIQLMEYQFKLAAEFAEEFDVEILLGEFGVNKNAPRNSRVSWIYDVVSMARKYNFGFVYWELAHNFGIYDIENDTWDDEMVGILVNRDE